MTATPETLMTPDEVEAGVAARLAAYTRGQRRGPLTGDVYLWAYGAALAGWRADRKRLEAAEKAMRPAIDALDKAHKIEGGRYVWGDTFRIAADLLRAALAAGGGK
jgi:hypothetical protein